MNNRCYRVIFSKAKGMLVVVSEATRSQGKSSNPSQSGSQNNHTQWAYSTIHNYIKKGIYPPDWGNDGILTMMGLEYD
ncbi:ESPR domain-containing protein [Psychrobacter sp. HD31]|uniref:ESPR domain-containing protein n=1 Tax=Psychrobacter sp. HD31 TaxID=3112003 RepID=UPI003DA6599A